MKPKLSLILTSLALGLSCVGGFSLLKNSKTSAEEVSAATYNRNQATYYTADFTHKVSSSSYGSSMLTALNGLMYDSHKYFNTYDEVFTYAKDTDYDIDNPDNIILLYSRQSINSVKNVNVWNREHVWCQSHGFFGTSTGCGSDLHHIRPASTAYNSMRGNAKYGIVSSHTSSTQFGDTDCYMSGSGDNDSFEPADYLKGDCARVIMYVYTHYATAIASGSYSGSLAITDIVKTSAGTDQAAWDLLMDWNESDPVDYQEMIRNNKCAYLLGNFNPFIDHPEFARMIWDDASTYQAGLFFQTSYKEVSVGSNYTNTATAWGNVSSSGSIVYTSDNPSIASVNSSTGQVTGVSNGVARIKARATINGVSKISYHFVKVGSGYAPKHTINASGIVYTPISTRSAVASATIGSETVSYTTSYSGISQLTSGNNLTLTIENFPKTVSSIILYMHSNKSSGTGTITVTVGGQTYKTISSKTFYQMYGSWSESFVPIDVTNSSASKKTGTISINISCSANSLFFQKAVIDYSERSITKATSISVTPGSIEMTPGEDNYLTTSFTPSSTTLQTCTWSSSNSNVATVSKYGLVRAIATGTATITATAGDGNGATGTTTINVVNSVNPGTVTGVTVSPSSASLDVYSNPTRTLSSTVSGTNNPSQSVTWSSSNSSVASVNSSGVVTAVGAGSCTITATSAVDTTKSGSCTISVTDSTPTLSTIAVQTAPTKTTYTAGEYFNPAGLIITRNFANNTSDTFSYSGHEASFTFTPSTSTVLTTSNTSVTIAYGGKSTTQAITVNESGAGTEDTEEGSVTASSGALEGWTASGTGSAYADGSVKFDSSSDYIYKLDIFDGDVSSGMTSLEVTINAKINGTPTSTNSYKVEALDSSGNVLASDVKTGSSVFTTNYGDVTFTMDSNLTGCTGIKITYVTKGGGNWGVKVVSWVATYTTSGSSQPTLQSITLDTTNVQTTFTVGDSFNYTNLVVTAHYSDSSSEVVTPTNVSAPNMNSTGSKTVTVTYQTVSNTYTITINGNPSISWTAPTINVYSGSTLSGTDVNGWAVTYNDGTGNTTTPAYNELTVKLGGTVISIPHTWVVADDGKTLTVTYNSLTTTASSAVQVTQSVNEISMSSEASSNISNLTFTAACGGSGTADDGKTWTITSDAAESNFDSTKGIHYGTGSAAVEYIQLVSNSFTTGTITQVVVNASGASGVSGSVSVTVGGNAFDEVKSFNSTASDKTFTGSASAGQIVVRIYKASAAVKAIYCKSVRVTFSTPGSLVTISNSVDHIEAQRLAVLFAKTFNDFMADTQYCTTGLDAAWASCSTAYTLFKQSAAALGETEEAWCLNLIKYATRQYSDDSGEACIERMMKTYEVCVQKHGKTAFMDDLVTLDSAHVSPLINVIGEKTNSVAVIVIISMVSVTAIGGYFFLKKRKETE